SHCERSEAISKYSVNIERLLRRFAPRNDSSGSVFAARRKFTGVRFRFGEIRLATAYRAIPAVVGIVDQKPALLFAPVLESNSKKS
ncbi:MAG: hypothetical protein OEU50_21520, partial [Gammaproteobacteria bacterium]|nr:hypothetical protein [Gammaproteobacteria bacterium]